MRPREWLASTLDPGWVERDSSLQSANPLGFPGYEPSADETVVAASGASGGYAVEAIVFDFERLGGSMGVVAGEKIARAFDRALGRRAAVVALTASGGARMQEGMVSLVQMAKVVAARDALRRAGLPFVAYLRNPTTGGVYASFASLADLIWAEPNATIGFAGPRVVEAMTGKPLPPGSHTAEFAVAHGAADATLPPPQLRETLHRALDLMMGRDAATGVTPSPEPKQPDRADAWEEVLLARHARRPTGAAFLRAIAPDHVELRGDRAGADDPGVVCALARIAGVRAMAIALDRTRPAASGFKKAQRAIDLAGTLGLPVVTFVDTPGADPSAEPEGIAHAIASTFRALLAHEGSVVTAVTGEGGSGGALALSVADRLLIMEHAIFSVIAPEGAAAILKRTDTPGVANELKLTSHELRRLGIADRVVAEPSPAAHADGAKAAESLAHAIGYSLSQLDSAKARDRRYRRWRESGNEWLVE